MSLVLESEIFTKELTGDSITITESMGVRRISVFNATAIVGTVIGTKKLGNLASSVINVIENGTINIAALEGSVIKNYTITAPAGCTLVVIAQ